MSRRLLLQVAALSWALSAPLAFADSESASPKGVQGEMLVWIQDAETKLIQLAEAVPESKYSWRPAKDVRSPGEVFMHVAAANYGLPSFLGVQPPEGFDFMSYEKSLTKKADIQKALKESFAHVKKSIATASPEDLEKPAEFFGMKTTARGTYLLVLSHAHEHLGQSIAYARVNGITPPWTAKEQAEAAAAAKKKAEK